MVSTTAYTRTNSIRLNSKDERESLSLFGRRDFKRERQNSNPKRRTRVRTRARFLYLSPSVPKPMENALESVRFESIKARFERTRERDDDASSIEPFKEREKKNRMNWFKNTNAQLRSSFRRLFSVPRSTSTRASRWGSGPARTGRRLCRCWQPCAN